MSNVIIGFPDFSDEVTWSGGSYTSTYPVTNLSNVEMARVARTSDATNSSTQASATLASERPVNLFAFVLPNASTDAQVQIVLKDTNGNVLSDSGQFDVFPAVFPTDELRWEDDNFWLGKYSADTLSGTLWTRAYEFTAVKVTKTIDVNFFDSGNSDGYLDIAYGAVAQSWQLSLNPTAGAQFGFRQSRTRGIRARGGAKAFDRLPKPNSWQGTVAFLNRDEAMAKRYELDRQLDIDKPFIWWPYPDEPRHWPRTVFIATNRQISRLRHASAILKHTEVPIDVEQVL